MRTAAFSSCLRSGRFQFLAYTPKLIHRAIWTFASSPVARAVHAWICQVPRRLCKESRLRSGL